MAFHIQQTANEKSSTLMFILEADHAARKKKYCIKCYKLQFICLCVCSCNITATTTHTKKNAHNEHTMHLLNARVKHDSKYNFHMNFLHNSSILINSLTLRCVALQNRCENGNV